MSRMVERGMSWLADLSIRHLSTPVTYTRGKTSVEVCAVVSRTPFEVDDGAGARVRFASRDFLIRAADLVLSGVRVLPECGDTIIEGRDGIDYTYEVMASYWQYSDPYWEMLKIHTKLVEVK